MERIPEPELMNETEQAEAYAAADFSEPHNTFVKGFINHFPEFREGHILDLGCGTGDVIIRLAKALPGIQITAVDGADEMLKIAERDIASNNLSDRTGLQRIFLPDRELQMKRFDAVLSNSLLHHLKDPYVLWDTVKVCAPAGVPIYIMDLARPWDIESAERLLAQYAADESPVLQKDFYNSLLAAYTVDEVRRQLESASVGFLNTEMVSDRHLLVSGRMEG